MHLQGLCHLQDNFFDRKGKVYNYFQILKYEEKKIIFVFYSISEFC